MPSRRFLLVLAAAALIAADLAIPGLHSDGGYVRIRACESAAIATLRAIASAQAQCRSGAVIDGDGDTVGEYAYLAELAGVAPLRGTAGALLAEPKLSSGFGKVSAAGCVARNGYLFRVFLPGATLADTTPAVPEAPGGGYAADGLQPDPDNAERLWCAYAWPSKAGKTGRRAFFVNQLGELLETPNADRAYSGEQQAPAFDAALRSSSPGDLAAPLGVDQANDGRAWSPLGG